MKRGLIVAALLFGIGVVTTSAQGRFWVLVNGAMRYTGLVVINGTTTNNVNALATTSTDGITLQNTTAATAGVTVQMSPRFRQCGTAWDTAASETVCFFTEVLPATAATPTGLWKLGYSLNGAAATYPLTVSSAGLTTMTGTVNAGNFQPLGAGGYYLGAAVMLGTTPTATTFCTSPTVPNANGTAAFTINVGTACATSAGVITLPAATTGWVVTCFNVTSPATSTIGQTGGTTTTATITNYVRTTGVAGNWTDSNILRCSATGY